ncbi:MAG TPA: phosphatase PAP2 family protein [Solirubrobacteraceae bacterium]|nr:phosphatase PAP2 family protein [Solirubrobacteraceae bacterium]
MLAATTRRPTSVLRAPFKASARAQVGLFVFAYLLYSAGRWITVGDLGVAKANADWIMDAEHTLGVAAEASVQKALDGTVFLWILNHLYLAAQLVVLPGSLYFLYRRSRPLYEKLRNTILATWLLSLPIYAAFPVAPPRLADVGLVDTITEQTGFALDSKLTTSFYNELAAVPSLHVGFAVAIGIALAAALRHPAAKLIALLWGPIIGLAVLATGNHFVFDIVAGVAVSAAGYGVGMLALRAGSKAGTTVSPATLRTAPASA